MQSLNPVNRPAFILLLIAALAGPVCAADEKPLGRSNHERFDKIDQNLVFHPKQGMVGGSNRSFQAEQFQGKGFYTDKKFSPGQFNAKTFGGAKDSVVTQRSFTTKGANAEAKYQVPNSDRSVTTKTSAVKAANGVDKSAATKEAMYADRKYLGPESKKLDRAIDPTKPLPGWAGDRMEVLSLEQIRELLNKNK